MAFKLIKGTFHVTNFSPDGDSVRFQPKNKELIIGLENGFRAKSEFNAGGQIQLRFEAIDALETHVNAPGGEVQQPSALADKATDACLAFLHIENVVWNANRKKVTSASDGTAGYILSRSVEKNGRPVSFVFHGETEEDDGADTFLDVERLRRSYNWSALSSGLAYPTYYKGLFSDLREELTTVVKLARQQNLGVHAVDGGNGGFDATSIEVITDETPILPKLFRRLVVFMRRTGSAVDFKKAMTMAAEPVLDLREPPNFTHFDTFIEQTPGSTRIKLTRFPEELVFDETIPLPAPAFANIVAEHFNAE